MCRYAAYLGQPLLLTDILYGPSNSLVHQASEASESRTRINADGFGIGWYGPRGTSMPAVFKDTSPAWNNANLRSLAGVVTSRCIMAHVRAAQRFDPISRTNCHPFQFGRLLWMHNGDIPGRARLHRRVVTAASDDLVARIRGTTDSELAFILFLHLLGQARSRRPSAEELSETMTRLVGQLLRWYLDDGETRPMALNFCVSDGRSIVALRYGLGHCEAPSLHYCQGEHFDCESGVCRMRDGGSQRCVILASEVLSEDPQWVTVQNESLVIVRERSRVEVRGLTPERLPAGA